MRPLTARLLLALFVAGSLAITGCSTDGDGGTEVGEPSSAEPEGGGEGDVSNPEGEPSGEGDTSSTTEPEPEPAADGGGEPDAGGGEQPEPEPEAGEDVGGEPEPEPGEDASEEPEPEPDVDASVEPEPEPEPEPEGDASGEPEPQAYTSATVPLAGPCDEAERVGRFTIEAEAATSFSFVEGKIANGVNPFDVQSVVGEEGPCWLRQVVFPFCDPLCAAGTTCDHDGTCVPFPKNQDAGTITVTGLSGPVEMEPKPPGNQYFDTKITHPAFEADSLVTLTSTVGYAGELELYGVGSELLELIDPEWVIDEDEDTQLTWTPPSNPEESRSSIFVELNIDQHGNSPVTLFCNLEDTGSAALPKALVAQLFAFGVSGYPNGRLHRQTTDSAGTDVGCVELLTRTPATPLIAVADHYPCNATADCPPGLLCNVLIQTCE